MHSSRELPGARSRRLRGAGRPGAVAPSGPRGRCGPGPGVRSHLEAPQWRGARRRTSWQGSRRRTHWRRAGHARSAERSGLLPPLARTSLPAASTRARGGGREEAQGANPQFIPGLRSLRATVERVLSGRQTLALCVQAQRPRNMLGAVPILCILPAQHRPHSRHRSTEPAEPTFTAA